jgi:hypothetical protein
MDHVPTPLTAEQEHALLRFLGSGPDSEVVMATPRAHYVAIPGEVAFELDNAHTLPGMRTVRYGRRGRTIYVADVDGGPPA